MNSLLKIFSFRNTKYSEFVQKKWLLWKSKPMIDAYRFHSSPPSHSSVPSAFPYPFSRWVSLRHSIQAIRSFSCIQALKSIPSLSIIPFSLPSTSTLTSMSASTSTLFSSAKRDPSHRVINRKNPPLFPSYSLEDDYFSLENDFLKNKQLISISPGGFKGFYLLGVLSFIRDHYDTSDFIFTGASAGAWNSLFMCLKKDDHFIRNLIYDEELKKMSSISKIEKVIKQKLLDHYKEEDFDFRKLFIGVTTMTMDLKMVTTIYTNFINLEDAIDCCIASSHIPFVTGGLFNQYNGKINFDGGFKQNPYLTIGEHTLHISPSMWPKILQEKEEREKLASLTTEEQERFRQMATHQTFSASTGKPPSLLQKLRRFWEHTTLLTRDIYDFIQLYEQGYEDSKKNKAILDDILVHRNHTVHYYQK